MLFEVAVLEKPKPKDAEEGKLENLVLKTDVVATDAQAAGLKVIMNEKTLLERVDPDRMILVVRPFMGAAE